MEGDSSIVMEDGCGDDMQSLGRRMVLMLLRAGILVGRVAVVVVGVMVMVQVGVVSSSEGRCMPVAKVEYVVVVGCGLVGGDVLNFVGGFCGSGGDGGGWFKVGGSCCCQNSLELCKWGVVLFAVFESKVFRREDVQCWWASLWCGDVSRFFDGVLFGGSRWFNRECGGGRNGCGSGREHGNG